MTIPPTKQVTTPDPANGLKNPLDNMSTSSTRTLSSDDESLGCKFAEELEWISEEGMNFEIHDFEEPFLDDFDYSGHSPARDSEHNQHPYIEHIER